MPKVRSRNKKKRHDPLYKQMTNDPGYLKAPKIAESTDEKKTYQNEEIVETNWATQRILENVREQQMEIAKEEKDDQLTNINSISSKFSVRDDSDEEEAFEEKDVEYQEINVSAEDEKMLSMFMSNSRAKRRTLADIIMEKIAEHEARMKANKQPIEKKQLNPKVIEVYTQVAKFMSHYTSGKVPKAFKIITTMRNWEEILQLTQPENWTPQAMFIATRMFAASTTERVAQRFYKLVLLPRVRQDIEVHRRLNYHLYRAVKKAIFKPTAFFRGLLLPLAMDSCTVREAVLISSILAKCSIPVLHAGVAMMKLSLMEYRGTQTLFLKTLLNKKYNLPFRVIDALVEHFTSFFDETRDLPVVWHQCLLTFVQRYKRSLKPKQKQTLKALSKKAEAELEGNMQLAT
ncbi:hypothetical protein AAMO2058_000003200 [Amorphochlora amoebiformis]